MLKNIRTTYFCYMLLCQECSVALKQVPKISLLSNQRHPWQGILPCLPTPSHSYKNIKTKIVRLDQQSNVDQNCIKHPQYPAHCLTKAQPQQDQAASSTTEQMLTWNRGHPSAFVQPPRQAAITKSSRTSHLACKGIHMPHMDWIHTWESQ